MDKFKEFQGRDLDDAIKEACGYFDSPREKLEIEIVQTAKSGIFGIVGARKAKVRARRAHLHEAVQTILGKQDSMVKNSENPGDKSGSDAPTTAPQTGVRESGSQDLAHASQRLENGAADQGKYSRKKAYSAERPENSRTRERRHKGKNIQPPSNNREAPAVPKKERAESLPVAVLQDDSEDMEHLAESWPVKPLEELDVALVRQLAEEITGALVRPIAGHDVPMSVELTQGRARVKVDWEGDAGLLIGREGQTLVAVQYLASRMLSRAMKAALRVQLDIGDYRRRQDEKLRELAHSLAAKARKTGRSFSTRPLSSYHRRIIHLALQEEADVHTRSSGEGPLKRVVISSRRQEEGI